MESLFELWGKRNPEWEKRYQSTIMDVFTDYGKGINQYQDIRGKIFGAGYEIYIIAFFIGLYFDQTKPLTEDKSKRKVLGQAIMYWGNVENRLGRTSYGKIREYMFAALIAKTNVDLLALDKGEITARSVVDELITKMEQYANFGFNYMEEKLEDDPNYFFKESAFLRVFTSFLNSEKEDSKDCDEDEPDSLDDEPEPLDEDDDIDVEKIIELQAKQEKEKWSDDDIDRLRVYFNHGMEFERISERLRKSVYSIKFQLSLLGLIDLPLDVTVENTDINCCIKNMVGEKVFEDDGKLIVVKEKIYCLNFMNKCFTIKEVKKDANGWAKGRTVLVVHEDSPLYKAITKNGINSIQEVEMGMSKESNKIKVNGTWYNYYGDVVKVR